MRMKKEIVDLEAKVSDVVFPIADHSFGRFTGWLRKIIEENCGYQIANTLEYCEYEQGYFVYIEVSNQLLPLNEREADDEADTANCTLRRTVLLNPKQPLTPQIEKINAVREALQKRFNLMSMCMSLYKEGYRMSRSDKTE